MTNTGIQHEVNTTIARWMGWTWNEARAVSPTGSSCARVKIGGKGPTDPWWWLPDYYNDRDAMAGAEEELRRQGGKALYRYASWLECLSRQNPPDPDDPHYDSECWFVFRSATASSKIRAVSLVRTIRDMYSGGEKMGDGIRITAEHYAAREERIVELLNEIEELKKETGLVEKIEDYFSRRGLKWPTDWESLAWLQTELAEVWELVLARNGGWVRNDPDRHGDWDVVKYGEELGDVIMMAMVAGMVRGVNPLRLLLEKMDGRATEAV